MLLVLGKNLSEPFRAYFNDVAANRSDVEILKHSSSKFRSNESFAELLGPSKNQDVVIIQSTSGDVDANIMHLLMLVADAKEYGAKSITAVMPFAAYARQDKKSKGRFVSLGAKLLPELLKAAGANKIITADVHSKAAENFYIKTFGEENVQFVKSAELFANDIKDRLGHDATNSFVGAPDGGDKPEDSAQIRAREVVRILHGISEVTPEVQAQSMCKIWKDHTGVNTTRVLKVEGNIANRHGNLIDDMSDSGGTIVNGGISVKQEGAKSVNAYLSHGLSDVQALEKILREEYEGAPVIDHVVFTDTVPGIATVVNQLELQYPGIGRRVTILPTAPLFAEKIFGPGFN